MNPEQTPMVYPYAERTAMQAALDPQALFEAPEVPLSPAEKTEAQAFARYLFNGRAPEGDGIVCETENTLEDSRSPVLASKQTFYLGYFESEAGQADLRTLGYEGPVDVEAIADTLRDVAVMRQRMDVATRKQIANRSVDWHKNILAERLAGDPAHDAGYPDIEGLAVHYAPDKLLGRLEDLRAYRHLYRQLRREVKEEADSSLKEAKQELLERHIACINEMFANMYPHAVSLAWQLERSNPTDQTRAWAGRLEQVTPIITRAFQKHQGNRLQHLRDFSDDFARRMDLARNGAALDEHGHISPMGAALLQIGTETVVAQGETAPQPRLSPDVIAVLDRTVWQADQVKVFVEAVLQHDGQLSAHQTTWNEAEERDGPAPDGGWQVVIHPKKDSMTTAGARRVIFVPQKFARTLTQESPAGVLPVVAHEDQHRRQNEYDERLGQHIPLARVKGARSQTGRELGGIEQERKVQSYLGRSRHTNLHYLRALQVKQQGGNQTQVARAALDSYTEGKQLTAEEMTTARRNAVDRVMRLYNNGGHDSKALGYIEQELVLRNLQNLTEDQRARLLVAGASFSLADALKLHRVGLFDLPTEAPASAAAAVFEVFTQQFLPAVLAEAEG